MEFTKSAVRPYLLTQLFNWACLNKQLIVYSVQGVPQQPSLFVLPIRRVAVDGENPLGLSPAGPADVRPFVRSRSPTRRPLEGG